MIRACAAQYNCHDKTISNFYQLTTATVQHPSNARSCNRRSARSTTPSQSFELMLVATSPRAAMTRRCDTHPIPPPQNRLSSLYLLVRDAKPLDGLGHHVRLADLHDGIPERIKDNEDHIGCLRRISLGWVCCSLFPI